MREFYRRKREDRAEPRAASNPSCEVCPAKARHMPGLSHARRDLRRLATAIMHRHRTEKASVGLPEDDVRLPRANPQPSRIAAAAHEWIVRVGLAGIGIRRNPPLLVNKMLGFRDWIVRLQRPHIQREAIRRLTLQPEHHAEGGRDHWRTGAGAERWLRVFRNCHIDEGRCRRHSPRKELGRGVPNGLRHLRIAACLRRSSFRQSGRDENDGQEPMDSTGHAKR